MYAQSIFKIVKLACFLLFFSLPLLAKSPSTTITITQIIEHPAADAVRQGLIEGLKNNGYVDGENVKIIYESAQGSPVTATQIAQKFVAMKPALMIPITTPSAQALVKADKNYEIPIVFAAVTDPLGAGVVESLEHPGGHVTGVTDAAPIQQQFKVFKEILPQLKTLGIIYNPGDNSSATPLQQARSTAKKMGIELIEATAFKTSEVPGAMKQLIGKKVQAVFVPLDNTILSAMNAVLKIAFQHKIPVFSSDSDSVIQGALASSGYTHYDTGYEAGIMAADILNGKDPGAMPVKNPFDLNVFVNPKSAQILNIEIPEEILKKAKEL